MASERANGAGLTVLRRFPWIEIVGTVAGTLYLHYYLEKPDLGVVFGMAGALLALGRLGFSAHLERDLTELRQPLERIGQFLDISSQAHFELFQELIKAYGKITEEEFAKVKDGIVKETTGKLLHLANENQSEVLSTTRYYGWLLPMLEHAVTSETILAVSRMREPEWDDSPPERRFIELSSGAAKRGVRIERVFVMKKATVERALRIEAVARHLIAREPRDLRGYFVDEDVLLRADEALFRALGDGFILFGNRVALVDVFSEHGARGYVTMNETEIRRLREMHEQLRILAEDLDKMIPQPSPEAQAASPSVAADQGGAAGA